MKRKIKKILKIFLYSLVILFLIISILPYFIPVNSEIIDVKNPPFAESKFTKIDNKVWHYRDFAAKDSLKGTIILIHGFSGSTFSWRKNQEVFADSGYRVISIDLPAFGFSEKESNDFDHSSYGHAINIWKLLDSAEIDKEKLVIAGHSMGASVAWEMAVLKPEKTSGLFLVDGAPNLNSKKQTSAGSAFLSLIFRYPPFLRWVDVIASAYYFKQNKFEELLSSAYGQKVDQESAAGYLRPFLLKNSGRAVIEAFIYSKKNRVANYSLLKCPVHLVWGSNDKWVPLSVGESFIKKIKKSSLKKFEAGHCPMETKPDSFNNHLLNELKLVSLKK